MGPKFRGKKRGGGGHGHASSGSGGGGSASVASTATASASGRPSTAPRYPLPVLHRHLGQRAHDGRRVRWRMDAWTWLHHLIALGVINAVMYEPRVGALQAIASGLAALWLGRRFLLEHVFGLSTRAIVTGRGDAIGLLRLVVATRVVLLALFSSLTYASCLLTIGMTCGGSLVLLGIMAVVELVTIVHLVRDPRLRDTALDTALTTIDALLTLAFFAPQFVRREHLLYDELAVAAAVGTGTIHGLVLAGCKNAVCMTPWQSEDAAERSRERSRRLVATIGALLDDDQAALQGANRRSPAGNNSATASNHVLPLAPERWGEWLLDSSAGQLVLWSSVQCLLVLGLLLGTAGVFLAWEFTTVLVASGGHVLWLVGCLRDAHARPHPLQDGGHLVLDGGSMAKLKGGA